MKKNNNKRVIDLFVMKHDVASMCNTITANSSSLLICALSSNNQIIYSAMDSAILLPLIIKTQ